MKVVRFLVLLWGLRPVLAYGQNLTPLKPNAYFSQPKIQLGEQVQFVVTIRYPSERRILFPDSVHSFQPFELIKKDYFPTKTENGLSFDSVVYTLSTFIPDSVQTLSVPIVEFQANDSLSWFSPPASVHVQTQIQGKLPNPPVVYEELSPVHIPTRFNYPYLLIALGVFMVLVLAINYFFNRPIQRFIYLFIERRRNQAYISQFQRLQNQLEKNLSKEGFERLINLWKKYNQRVDGKPYTTFTSTEIFRILPEPSLKEALQDIDRWIYGGVEMKDWKRNLLTIKEISLQLYQNKREAIRNGKFD